MGARRHLNKSMAAVLPVAGRPEMYSLKPINDVVDVEVPSCMYTMTNLHRGEEEMDVTDPDMKSLLEKDKKITADLQHLTEELKQLSHRLGHKFGESNPIVSTKVQLASVSHPELPDGINDFVISVSPSQPALSAVLIADLLTANGFHVATPTQRHSSLSENVPSGYLAATGGWSGRLQHKVEKLVFTFVWKENPFCPSVMQSPLLQTKIIGDANIGRYLCRILSPQLYNENNIDQITAIDKWIDISVQMTNGNTKEKDSAMKSMNSHLGKNNFFCGENITLADVTLLASLLSNINSFKSLPKNVKKWFSQISTYFTSTVSKFTLPESWTVQ